MRVRCVNKGENSLYDADISSGNTRRTQFHVTVGKEYFVYGVMFYQQVVCYLLESDLGSPDWLPASLFEIKRGEVSRRWVVKDWSLNKYVNVISYPELSNDIDILDGLSLHENESIEKFRSVQRVADLEFRDDTVLDIAEQVGGGLVRCSKCSNVWPGDSLDEMLMCPDCNFVMLNPCIV